MTLWIILALMTGAAVLAVLWPLSRHARRDVPHDADSQFYRSQIAEIERDQARGLIPPLEADAAKAEAGRRLLHAAAAAEAETQAFGEPALRRRRAASALALSTIPLLALAAYGALGSPQLPAEPLATRLRFDPERLDMAAAVAKVEAYLAASPEDGRGWEVIAPVYLRLGRNDDAVKAYAAAVRLLGETPERVSAYGEALVAAAQGVVSTEARRAFERALVLNPMSPKPQFYLARAAEQDGDNTLARSRYEAMLASGPADAPWLSVVREQLVAIDARESAASVAALPTAERESAVRGMVDRLATRLESGSGTPEDWQRLVRSYAVLGDRDKASAALTKARAALAPDKTAMASIDALAGDLGLSSDESKP
jgi:cytochrome c-type biogenesis protein CcmH